MKNKVSREKHYCNNIDDFPLDKYCQFGAERGQEILIVGESPADNGWRKSNKACYTEEGKLLATGRRINELFKQFGVDVETCGFTELAKCYIGKNRKILSNCAVKCWPIFLRQLKIVKPRLIVLMGVETLRIFCQLAGIEVSIGTLERVSLEGKDYKILGIWHPSPINPWGKGKNIEIFRANKELIRKMIEQPIIE